MTSTESAAPSPWTYPAGPGGQAPRQGKGLAITAIVLSALALLGVVIIGAVVAFMIFAATGFDNYVLYGSAETSQGQVAESALEPALRKAIEDDGGTPTMVECPETSKVGPGLSVICDMTIDDIGWVAVVVFADNQGEFSVAVY
ncbi:DUF4333 domain-containing protein [Nocardioides sp. WS12]|uniref:DUF4333 domain-containing protein n=1 Tax=Nocardioides sp. WS12 TaxID=2486272 RepID=UPI0015F8E574|nr:DUF4333 domain-containing protein [Nocardioides sp. WS12]